MAAPMKCMSLCRRNCLNLLKSRLLLRGSLQFMRFSTNIDEDEDNREEFEKEVAKLRDVSNMNDWVKRRHLGKLPDIPEDTDIKLFKNRSFYRRLFAEAGNSSGLNPGIMWPSKAELESLVHEEKHYEPTFQELVQKIKDKKALEAEEARKRDEKIDKSMAKMDELIRQYRQRQEITVGKTKKEIEKNEQLLIEFRDYYGYTVQETDSKFKEFRMRKLEDEKLEKKKAKKQTKKDKAAQSLQEFIDKGVQS